MIEGPYFAERLPVSLVQHDSADHIESLLFISFIPLLPSHNPEGYELIVMKAAEM